jgi:septum site-determining protein MinC
MSVAIAGNAPATFEIKSANLPLVALRLKSTDLDALAAELSRQYGDIPDFFDNDPLIVDLSPLPADAPGPDFAALIALLRFHRLAPLAFKGGTAQQAAAALAAGLVGAPDAATVKTATTAQQAIGQSPPAAPAVEPELISIAGIYRTTENALPPEVWGRATQVRLVAGPEGERLVMEPLSS